MHCIAVLVYMCFTEDIVTLSSTHPMKTPIKHDRYDNPTMLDLKLYGSPDKISDDVPLRTLNQTRMDPYMNPEKKMTGKDK